MTTYEMIHGNMECPFCGKILIEHELSDKVACRDANCKFNDEINIAYKDKKGENYNANYKFISK